MRGEVRASFLPEGGDRLGSLDAYRCIPGRSWALWVPLLVAVGLPAWGAAPASLEERRLALYQEFALADQLSDSTATSSSAAARPRFDPSRQYFYLPSAVVGVVERDAVDAADAGDERASELASPRPRATTDVDRPRAAELFALAREALQQGQGALAYRLAHEVLQFDPAHASATRWLGLSNSAATTGPSISVRLGRRPHARYRWPAGEYLQISTPHFQLTSNDRPANARRLAETLEALHGVWQQLFFDCWSSTDALRARDADAGSPRRRRARHQVVMFRERDEYLKFVRQIEPQAELTRGYYHAPTRTAFLVGGDQPLASTWLHEVTHQLFHESTPTARQIGDQHNFWIVEGAAMYLESLQRCRQWLTVGGLEAERLQDARFRALREGFYLPLESLAALDRAALQTDPRIRQIYSQAAGLTHFLMDGQQRRYQPALMQYLQLVYRQRDTPDSLPRLTAAAWDDLDRQYRDFLQVDDRQLQQLDPDITIRQLCLGGTSVGDAGLLSLPDLAQVTWLDLYGTQLTDRGTLGLERAARLEQLNLEQTRISDDTVARLGQAAGLKQLDLSGTRISDAALPTIGQLTQLESLWLTNTRVTDEGLRQLTELKQLRVLDLSGTRTTDAGRAALRAALPRLSAE